MKNAFILLLALIFLVCAVCCAEEDFDRNKLFEYGAQKCLLDSYTVRSCYRISLPESEDLSEEVMEAYGSYASIFLIEYGYCRVLPIIESQFICIGITGNSEFEKCLTPFDLIARTYNPDILSGVNIEEVNDIE